VNNLIFIGFIVNEKVYKTMKESNFKKFFLLFIVIVFFCWCFSFGQYKNTKDYPDLKSNSKIMDKPNIEYEKPKVEYGRSQWWAWYGYTYSESGDELLLNANIYPHDGTLYGNSYTLNKKIETFNFKMDIKWNEKTNTLYGTMKRESDSAIGTWKLRFPSDGYRIYEQKVAEESLKIEMRSRGIPLWGGRNKDEMLQVGWAKGKPVYGAGFHDCVVINATLIKNGKTLNFKGFGMYARAWLTEQIRIGEAVVGFINEQPEFYINFMYIRNPYNLDEIFVKQGRIGFSDKAYTFDNFIYSGDYWPDLKWFRLQGTFEDGKVDLIGVNEGFLHNRQKHPLIRWKGTIIRNGKTIQVNSRGSGEFRQLRTSIKKRNIEEVTKPISSMFISNKSPKVIRYLPPNKLKEIEKICEEVKKNPTNKNNLIDRLTKFIEIEEYLVKQGVQLKDVVPPRTLIQKMKEEREPKKFFLFLDETMMKLCKVAKEPIIINRSFQVDCSKEIGRIRSFAHVNGGPLQGKLDRQTFKVIYLDFSNQYMELGIESVRKHDFSMFFDVKEQKMKAGGDMSTIFPDYSKDPEKEESYNFKYCDKAIKSSRDIGIETFFRIGESWGRDEDKHPPPPDFDKFANAAAHIVRHYNFGWANGFYYNIKYWEIWNEPGGSKFWYGGTPEQYFQLYEKTARAIKEVDKNLTVGGPGNTPADTLSKKWGYGFLKYVKENNVPLDFYSWHIYTSRPLEVLQVSKDVRKMLNEIGLNNVESIITEWNQAEFLPSPPGTFKRRPNHREFFSSIYNAAYTAAVLIHLQDTDVIFAHRYRGDAGGMGLFEYDGSYRKPAYAYKAFREMIKHPVRLELKGLEDLPEGFTAIAGISEDKNSIALLISDYREGKNPYMVKLFNLPFTETSLIIERYILDEKKNLDLVELKSISRSNELILNNILEGPAVELIILRKE